MVFFSREPTEKRDCVLFHLWTCTGHLINNGLLYHFLANWLAHNKKMTEKSFFAKLGALKWRHNRSQSPGFGLVFCTPPEVKFDAFGTSKHGEGKSLSKFFLLYLSVHWGDLVEQIKNICHMSWGGGGGEGGGSGGGSSSAGGKSTVGFVRQAAGSPHNSASWCIFMSLPRWSFL